MAKVKQRIEEFKPDARLVDERGPTPERASKIRPTPVNTALALDKLTRAQGLAAEKFYNHWHRGGMIERIPSVEFGRVFGGDGFQVMARSENEAFHRDRYRKAKELIEREKGGLSFWVLEQIVCHEKTFTEVGAIFGHKNRTKAAQVSFEILVPALDRLCSEWGIS